MADEKFVAKEEIFFGSARGYMPSDEVDADVVKRFELNDLVRGPNNDEKRAAKARKPSDPAPNTEPTNVGDAATGKEGA